MVSIHHPLREPRFSGPFASASAVLSKLAEDEVSKPYALQRSTGFEPV